MYSANKVKIIGTIGPASHSEDTMRQLLLAGMNIARLNFSHGDFATHQENIQKLRRMAEKTGKRLAIMADLPGPNNGTGTVTTTGPNGTGKGPGQSPFEKNIQVR